MKKGLIAVCMLAGVLALSLSACGGQTQSSSSGTSSGTDTSSTATQQSTTIDAAKFKQIKQGMSYKEVVAIIGSEGEQQSSSKVSGIKVATYQWQSDDYGTAIVEFENNKVVNKTQVGVGESTEAVATKANFKKVKNGMSYKQVVEIFGGEGQLTSDTKVAGTTAKIYSWNGSTAGANCTVNFSNGKVTAKAQSGLE